MEELDSLLQPLRDKPWALTLLQLSLLAAAVWLSSLITKSLLVRGIGRAMRSMPGLLSKPPPPTGHKTTSMCC